MFNNTLLKQQIRIETIVQWGKIVVMCGLLMACSHTTIDTSTEKPPDEVDFRIDSIEVLPFSSDKGNYGAILAEQVKNRIAKNGYIQVVDHGGQTILTGTVNIGHFNNKEHQKSHQTKDAEGRQVTEYTHYYKRNVTTSVIYSLKQGSQTRMGNDFTENYEREWSGKTAAEARAKAESDDQIITGLLDVLAQRIVSAVSPHSENVEWTIPCSRKIWGVLNIDKVWCWKRPDSIKQGVQYYENSLYDQAETAWKQALEQATSSEYKAQAHYLMGVLRAREGRYAEAKARFKQADELEPGNDIYISALAKVKELLGDEVKIKIFQ